MHGAFLYCSLLLSSSNNVQVENYSVSKQGGWFKCCRSRDEISKVSRSDSLREETVKHILVGNLDGRVRGVTFRGERGEEKARKILSLGMSA